MNLMNDERFFDLAMKAIARQSTDAERAELDALLAREPGLRTAFVKLEADVRVAKETLPLVQATQATTGQLPAYARERLQTKVRQTLGRPEAKNQPDRSLAWGWRWVLGLAAATAIVFLAVLPLFRTPDAPVIQLAMLDMAGGTRGNVTNEIALLQTTWKVIPIQTFSDASKMEAWEKDLPIDARRPTAKIIYDAAAGEVRVSGHLNGRSFQKSFPLEKDLAATLRLAKAFVKEQGF